MKKAEKVVYISNKLEELYPETPIPLNHTDDYNSQKSQFLPANFKNHLKKLMPERIEKTDAGYFATTGDGRRLSKTPKSKKAALSQLAAVEISKHKNKIMT